MLIKWEINHIFKKHCAKHIRKCKRKKKKEHEKENTILNAKMANLGAMCLLYKIKNVFHNKNKYFNHTKQ